MVWNNHRASNRLTTSSAWVSLQDRMPPKETVIVRVSRKADAALAGPREWEMWACNVRMHTDEVGWWMPNAELTDRRANKP